MRRLRKHAGKSADFDFVESYYRMMLSGGGHVVTVRTLPQDGGTPNDGGDDVASAPSVPSTHILYAERRARYLSYACEVSEGSYATKYAHTSYVLSNDERLYKTEYCFTQDGQRMQLFQTLNGSTTTGTLLFESVMPYTMVPMMMIEQDSRVILCMNALHSDSNGKPDDGGDDEDGCLPIHTGYIYVISIDMLDGQWRPLFESDKQIRYSVHGAVGGDGRIGILLANICDNRKGAIPIPRAFRDIPRYVMEDSPHEGPSMNVPYGVSIYSPESSNFTLVPIGGNADWGIVGIDISGDANAEDGIPRGGDDDGAMRGRNLLRVVSMEKGVTNAVGSHAACTGGDETLDSGEGVRV